MDDHAAVTSPGFRLACRFDLDSWPSFARGFRIGEEAYVVTDNAVCVLQLPGWERVTTYELSWKQE